MFHIDVKYLAVILVLAGILIIYLHGEGFSTADEKADAVHRWFKENPTGDYAKFRSDLKRQSNIVEYEDIRKLAATKPNFTVSDVKKIV